MQNYLKSMSSVKLLVLISLWVAPLVPQPTPPVQLSGGVARGTVAPDGTYLQYVGIPYATVTHRFQEAQPNPTWEGEFDARNEHIRCNQRFFNRIMGVEDCLTVNVYTPIEASGQRLPVMVFIHGGGFRDGSGSPFIYGPKFLVKHGVILVTVNYRVEVLGFLCLGIKEAPGNMGLKDQVQALQWVKRNIRAFGGDPDNVTIFGESAGAASVSYHLLSPMSKGLFNKAIMQSGSSLAPWALQFEPLETAIQLAQEMGHTTRDPLEIYKLFSNMTAEDLLSYRVPRQEGDIVQSQNIFVPCIEKKIHRVKQFLPDSPYNLITRGKYNKVPVIVGFNDAEGLYFAGKENETTLANLDLFKALPRDLTFPSDKEKKETAEKVRELYMGDEKFTTEISSLEKLARFEGDVGITYPVVATIDLLLRTLDKAVYAYKFSYDGLLNFSKFAFGFRKTPGATHADEIFYLFSSLTLNGHLEKDFIEKFTTLWTNFAKYGDPTPSSSSISPRWEPAEAQRPQVYVIDKESSVAPVWDDEGLLFWNQTYSMYRRTQ
uniref:Carboxylic ester hydrolase n=1 Tax=Spodoptera frugiperda TaxID=7108 RepID=A0A5Q0TZ09_SPOFR|nr:carboxylesterase CXE20 [Spodoptera frugiperda]